MYTKPTGLSLEPPLGPAIPVIETHTSALLIFFKLFTIAKQHWILTDPCFVINFFDIFKILLLALSE